MSTDCKEKCQRLHPHCELRFSRNIAPDTNYHWSVVMPDGHMWSCGGKGDLEAVVADMNANGIPSLMAADKAWRDNHPIKG